MEGNSNNIRKCSNDSLASLFFKAGQNQYIKNIRIPDYNKITNKEFLNIVYWKLPVRFKAIPQIGDITTLIHKLITFSLKPSDNVVHANKTNTNEEIEIQHIRDKIEKLYDLLNATRDVAGRNNIKESIRTENTQLKKMVADRNTEISKNYMIFEDQQKMGALGRRVHSILVKNSNSSDAFYKELLVNATPLKNMNEDAEYLLPNSSRDRRFDVKGALKDIQKWRNSTNEKSASSFSFGSTDDLFTPQFPKTPKTPFQPDTPIAAFIPKVLSRNIMSESKDNIDRCDANEKQNTVKFIPRVLSSKLSCDQLTSPTTSRANKSSNELDTQESFVNISELKSYVDEFPLFPQNTITITTAIFSATMTTTTTTTTTSVKRPTPLAKTFRRNIDPDTNKSLPQPNANSDPDPDIVDATPATTANITSTVLPFDRENIQQTSNMVNKSELYYIMKNKFCAEQPSPKKCSTKVFDGTNIARLNKIGSFTSDTTTPKFASPKFMSPKFASPNTTNTNTFDIEYERTSSMANVAKLGLSSCNTNATIDTPKEERAIVVICVDTKSIVMPDNYNAKINFNGLFGEFPCTELINDDETSSDDENTKQTENIAFYDNNYDTDHDECDVDDCDDDEQCKYCEYCEYCGQCEYCESCELYECSSNFNCTNDVEETQNIDL